MNLAKLLRQHRLDAGYTLADAAKLIGYTLNYIYEIESKRRNPSAAYINNFADQFELTNEDMTQLINAYFEERR